MTERMPVLTALPAYRAAVAELPLTTRLTVDPRGAVVIVDGWRGAIDAASVGAVAVIIADPGSSGFGEQESLDLGVPVVVGRSRLRPDVAEDAVSGRRGAMPRAITVDSSASRPDAAAALRDAVGWARALAGGALELRAARATTRGATALLERDGIPCSIGIGFLADAGGMLRVTALGETVTDVTVDAAAGPASVETSTAAGLLRAPARSETAERLALRRAVAAVRNGTSSHDLDELFHDTDLAVRILASA